MSAIQKSVRGTAHRILVSLDKCSRPVDQSIWYARQNPCSMRRCQPGYSARAGPAVRPRAVLAAHARGEPPAQHPHRACWHRHRRRAPDPHHCLLGHRPGLPSQPPQPCCGLPKALILLCCAWLRALTTSLTSTCKLLGSVKSQCSKRTLRPCVPLTLKPGIMLYGLVHAAPRFKDSSHVNIV